MLLTGKECQQLASKLGLPINIIRKHNVPYWIMEGGIQIKHSDMEDEHIERTISLIEKDQHPSSRWRVQYALLRKELADRNEKSKEEQANGHDEENKFLGRRTSQLDVLKEILAVLKEKL
jgi:hypothetical protein